MIAARTFTISRARRRWRRRWLLELPAKAAALLALMLLPAAVRELVTAMLVTAGLIGGLCEWRGGGRPA